MPRAPAAESAQNLLALRPYQGGLTRKPFRCPGSPETLAGVGGRWLLTITRLLGEYDPDIQWDSVRFGSGGVMLMPGTALPIVAVHSQHRGRLFLPFAADDSRTAEVLSKVLLLARDREIRYPRILEWIRAGQGGGTG
jgi:hypothetical protein